MTRLLTHLLLLGLSTLAGAWLDQALFTHSETSQRSTLRSSNVTVPGIRPEPRLTESTIQDPFAPFEEPEDVLAAWGQVLDWLDRQPAASLEQGLRSLEKHDLDPETAWPVNLLIVSHWADLDREAAMAHLLKDKRPDELDPDEDEITLTTFFTLYSSWARQEPAAARAALIKIPKLARYKRLLLQVEAFYHREYDLSWAAQAGADLAAFVELWWRRGLTLPQLLQPLATAAGQLTVDERQALTHAIFLHTAKDASLTIEKAMRLANELPHEEDRESAFAGMLEGWKRHPNPLTALKALHGLRGKVELEIGLFHDALSAYPETTIDWVLHDLDEEGRREALRSIYSNAGSSDTEASGWLKLYEALPPSERPSVSSLLFLWQNLTWYRPRESLDWLRSFPENADLEDSDRSRLASWASSLGQTLATQDTDESLALLETIDEGPIRQSFLQGIITQLSTDNLARAASLLDQLTEENRRSSEATVVAGYFAHEGLEKGMAYLDSVDDPETQQTFAVRLLNDHRLEPAERARLVDTYLAQTEDPLRSTHYLNEHWAESDPQAASDWLPTHQSSRSYPYRVERLMERWRYKDFEGATQFAQTLEFGPVLDDAIFYLTSLSREIDPWQTLQWSSRISDPEKRLKALERDLIRADELATEANAVSQILAGLDLTAAERGHLEERLSP